MSGRYLYCQEESCRVYLGSMGGNWCPVCDWRADEEEEGEVEGDQSSESWSSPAARVIPPSLGVKTHGLLTTYRSADGAERSYLGEPDIERDSLAAVWGWSILRTKVVAKADYDALLSRCRELGAGRVERKPRSRRRVRLASQSTWYPPSRFVLMPIYRQLRRRLGCRRQAFALLMVISGLLHVAAYSALGFWGIAVFQAAAFATLALAIWTRPEACRHCAHG